MLGQRASSRGPLLGTSALERRISFLLFGLDFGNGPLTPTGPLDYFVAKLTPSFAAVWSKGLGNAGLDNDPPSGAVAPDDGVVLVGGFDGTLDFGGGVVLAGTAPDDAFVARLPP